MTHEIARSIEISATPGAIWHELMDTAAYGTWNPFIHRLQGDLREGEQLEVEIQPPGGRSMVFKPTVLEVEPQRRLRWLGHLLVPGLLDGEHSFRLETVASGRVRLTQAERFSGFFVRPLRNTLEKTARGFDEMNIALKRRAEGA